ncbi:MAG: hypothetical protein ABIP51_07245 [Bacteroidia bacterium]
MPTTFTLKTQTEKNWESGTVSINEYIFDPQNNIDIVLRDFFTEENFKLADFNKALRDKSGDDFLGHAFNLHLLEPDDFKKRSLNDLTAFMKKLSGEGIKTEAFQPEIKYITNLLATAGTTEFYIISANMFDLAHPKNKNGAFYTYYHLVIWFNSKESKITVCQIAME